MAKKLTSDEAFDLAEAYRTVSVTLGDYRFSHWTDLTAGQRKQIEDVEWTLLNASSDMTTTAVGLVLDESELSLSQLRGATTKANAAIKKLKTVKKVIRVATALVGLAAAVMSKDPGAILKNAQVVYKAAAEDS